MYGCRKHEQDPEASQDLEPPIKVRTDDCKLSVVQEKSFYSLIGTSEETDSSETSSHYGSSDYERESEESSEYDRESVESTKCERESVESYDNESVSNESLQSSRQCESNQYEGNTANSTEYEREFELHEKIALISSSASSTDVTVRVNPEGDDVNAEEKFEDVVEDDGNDLNSTLESLYLSKLFEEHPIDYHLVKTESDVQFSLDLVDIGSQMTDSSFILIESTSPSLDTSSNQFLRNLAYGRSSQPFTLFGILNKFSKFYCLGVDLRSQI